jgi:methylglutamate dehydrogenase subunit D
MASSLTAHSGLEHVLAAHGTQTHGDAGVMVALGRAPALAMVMVRRTRLPALVACVREAFGLEIANRPRCVIAGPIGFVWAGPGQWLAMHEDPDGATLERRLRAALGPLASVSDQSDGRIVMRVGGSRARDLLAKGVPIDLHPMAFGPGDAAVTIVAHIGAHIWQVDETPTYELIVARSYAAAFLEWLLDAAAEFGVSLR